MNIHTVPKRVHNILAKSGILFSRETWRNGAEIDTHERPVANYPVEYARNNLRPIAQFLADDAPSLDAFSLVGNDTTRLPTTWTHVEINRGRRGGIANIKERKRDREEEEKEGERERSDKTRGDPTASRENSERKSGPCVPSPGHLPKFRTFPSLFSGRFLRSRSALARFGRLYDDTGRPQRDIASSSFLLLPRFRLLRVTQQ